MYIFFYKEQLVNSLPFFVISIVVVQIYHFAFLNVSINSFVTFINYFVFRSTTIDEDSSCTRVKAILFLDCNPSYTRNLRKQYIRSLSRAGSSSRRTNNKQALYNIPTISPHDVGGSGFPQC
jgi:hypothetical protein